MKNIRSLLLAAVLWTGLAPAFAQSPTPVPPLPDTERRTSYTISASKCSCAVGFAIYGDGSDYQNWVEVWINGVRAPYNDASVGWTLTSPTIGSFSSAARPITNAIITFNSTQTGTVQIVGARKPRRVSQYSESRGVPARNLNQDLTDIVAMLREDWDKINDVSGRAVLAPPGETLNVLATASARANSGACFDASGQLVACVSVPSTTFTAGNGIAITGTSPKTITNNITSSGPITITGTNPLTIGCPTCNTSPASATSAIFVASRATALTLDLSSYTVVRSGGYTTGGDGGGGTFAKVTGPFVDNYITGLSTTNVGAGCANGTYYGVSASNLSGSLAGHGALLQITVAGNVVTSATATTFGNQYAVGDVLSVDFTSTSLTCTTPPQFTVGGVATPTCSFTDLVGTKWQLVVEAGTNLNIKQCGAKVNYLRSLGDVDDDTAYVQNALYFAADILPPTIDAYGEAGTILEMPRGISLVGTLTIPQGVWFRGKGRYSSGLKMLNTLPMGSNWITVCDRNTRLACFGTQLTDMTLWNNGTPSANAGTAMVFTNNLQQATGFARLNVVAGSRMCFDLEIGYGGAALLGFEDVECGSSYATNPGWLINYASAIVTLKNVIVETGVPGLAQSGIAITAGYVNASGLHCEQYQSCVNMNVPVNSGHSYFQMVTAGGSGCVNAIVRQAGSAAGVNKAGMVHGSCTNKLNNAGTTTTTDIMADVVF